MKKNNQFIMQKLKEKVSSERGEIGESLITVTAIALAAVLMFIFPLMTMADRNDEIAQLAIETTVREFVDDVRTKGTLTWDDYDKLVQDLSATGNTYDIEMTRTVRDENEAKKVAQAVAEKIGEDTSFTEFTSQILEKLGGEEGAIIFKEGDIFSTAVKQSNQGLAQQFKNFLYSVAGSDISPTAAEYAGMCTRDGN